MQGPSPHRAPLGRRLWACGLDFLVVAAYLLVLLGLGLGARALFAGEGAAPLSILTLELLAFLTTVLPVTLYFGLQEGGRAQATWGKRRAGLQVRTRAGAPVSRPRALLRAAVKFAPWQLAHSSLIHIPGWPTAPTAPAPWVIAGLAFAQALVLVSVLLLCTRSRRALHDRAAGTVVVRG